MGDRRKKQRPGTNRRPNHNRQPKPRYSLFAGRPTYIDYQFILAVFFLISFGLIMLYSASAYSGVQKFDTDMFYFGGQLKMTIVGIVAMIFVSKIEYHQFGIYSKLIYIVSIFLMFLVRTPLGDTRYGARRWLKIPGTGKTIQPSEAAKIAIIVFTAYLICYAIKKISKSKGFIPIMVMAGFTGICVRFFTDNLSTAIIVVGIPFVMMFVAYPDWRPFVRCFILAAILGVIAIILALNTADADVSFRLTRILTWLDQEKYSGEGGYQVLQGLYAIGSGGFWGKGLGNSTQKLGVIPEVQNDMILSIICEELGIFGVLLILALFGYLIYRMVYIAQNAPDLFGTLIVVGVIAHISIQVILNIAVVTNFIPTTGITLPFFSFGGTSIVFLLMEIGMVMGVARKIKIQ